MKTPLIPSNIVRKLGVDVKRSNQEVIVDYLTQEQGSVELSEKQKELLDRWDFADNLVRSRKYKRSEITKMICVKFGVAIATARNDLADAEYIFGSTRKFSKQYLLLNHIDEVDDMIVEAQRQRNDDLVLKLLVIRTKAIEMLPDQMQKEMAPTKIIYNLTQNNTTQELYLPVNFTEEDAKRIAARKLQELNIDLEPLDLAQYKEVEDE